MTTSAPIASDARLVRDGVRRLTRRSRGARAIEASLAGVASALLAASLARVDGVDPLARANAAAAVIAGVACAIAWYVERRSSPREIAIALDDALARRGELTTAFELAEQGASGGVGELLMRRASGAIASREVASVVAPPSLALVIAVLLAGAAFEISRQRAAPPALDAAGIDVELALAADALAAAGSEAPPELEPAIAELARRLRGAAAVAPPVGEIGELDRRAAALETRVEGLQRLSSALRRSRAALARSSGGDAAGAGASSADARAGEGASSGVGLGDPSPTDGLAAVDRSGSPPGDSTGSTVEPSGGPTRAEPGVLPGRWWAARHDELVRRWLERERNADDR